MNGSTVRRSRRTLRRAAGAVVTMLVLLISTAPAVLADSPPDQTITFAAAPTGVVVGGSGFSVSASASSGLAVTYPPAWP